MKISDEVRGALPEFSLTQKGNSIDVYFWYYLSGYEDEEAGFTVFEGDAYVEVAGESGSVSRSYGGDAPLNISFTVDVASGVTYEGNYSFADYNDNTEVSLDFSLTSFSKSGVFKGRGGMDIVFGSSGADMLSGADGNDFIEGGAGADTLNGGSGKDALYGGSGNDAYSIDNAGDKVIESPGGGIDLVNASISYRLGVNLERLALLGSSSINATGNSAANVITGNPANNVIDGKADADIMRGGKGNDTYLVDDVDDAAIEKVSEGTDLVKTQVTYHLPDNFENLLLSGEAKTAGTGNSLANAIAGNGNANKLWGLSGNDTLDGKSGADALIGGTGADRLTGGIGKDVFVFERTSESTSSAYDTITDFNRSDDLIDLAKIDANTEKSGNQAFKFIGTSSFHDVAGELRYFISSNGATYVRGDTDGDGKADFQIKLAHNLKLTSDDFVL